MNPRIELVSDTEVRIQRGMHPACVTRLISASGLRVLQENKTISPSGGESPMPDYDAEGRAALIDALQCLRDTNSFAALADTSPVEFTGKKMRWLPHNEEPQVVTLIGKDETFGTAWHCVKEDGSRITTNVLAALTPAPRVRPYTPVEAAAHLGRKLSDYGGGYKAKSVDEKGIRFEKHSSWMHVNYDGLAGDKHTWDDGTPCGIVEEA